MTFAFFSDIHANLPALEALFEDIDRRHPDMVFCLGDLVGYAPWPNEVVEMIRSRGIPTIAGNYDEGVGLASDDCGCAYKTDEERARGVQSISFTNAIVTDRTREYLRLLPRQLRVELGTGADRVVILMVHGSPRKINEYLGEDRPEASLWRMMEEAGADIMLFGHTHKPYHRALRRDVDGEPRFRHAINIGSVGKPKDGDPRACYVHIEIRDTADNRGQDWIGVEFIRVPYDVERAATAVEASPLPDVFAEMLRQAW